MKRKIKFVGSAKTIKENPITPINAPTAASREAFTFLFNTQAANPKAKNAPDDENVVSRVVSLTDIARIWPP